MVYAVICGALLGILILNFTNKTKNNALYSPSPSRGRTNTPSPERIAQRAIDEDESIGPSEGRGSSLTYHSGTIKRANDEGLSKTSILKDICKDLTYLFYIRKPGKFVGPLEALNNPNTLKNLLMVEDKESCTINKKTIHLCTKDPQNGRTYDKNTLMFVVLHELAHVLCEDVGHTERFSTINTALLNYAIENGLYDPSKPFVKNYCALV